MKCTIRGCPGHYECRRIVHAVKRQGAVLVFDEVPADVCDVCSDTLLAPQTIRHLEDLMSRNQKPRAHAPLYQYS